MRMMPDYGNDSMVLVSPPRRGQPPVKLTVGDGRFGERLHNNPRAIRIPLDHDIPMPAPRVGSRQGVHKYAYPWHDMEVGDSFIYPARENHRATHKAASTNIAYRQSKWPQRYAIRTLEERQADGTWQMVCRVWRTM